MIGDFRQILIRTRFPDTSSRFVAGRCAIPRIWRLRREDRNCARLRAHYLYEFHSATIDKIEPSTEEFGRRPQLWCVRVMPYDGSPGPSVPKKFDVANQNASPW
jgi:hypothetical protein